jgi:hypothetical protein
MMNEEREIRIHHSLFSVHRLMEGESDAAARRLLATDPNYGKENNCVH